MGDISARSQKSRAAEVDDAVGGTVGGDVGVALAVGSDDGLADGISALGVGRAVTAVVDVRAERALKRAEHVARAIVSHIVDQDMQPGDALPNQQAMIDMFGAGRGTVREALRLLETQGVIVIRPGRNGGPLVRGTHPAQLVNSTTLNLQLLRTPFTMIIEARAAVEPEVARLAAKRRTAAEVAAMWELVAQMRGSVESEGELRAAYAALEQLIRESARNPALSLYQATLQAISHEHERRVPYSLQDATATVKAYEHMIDALESRDSAAAYELATLRIKAYRAHIMENFPSLLNEIARWIPTP